MKERRPTSGVGRDPRGWGVLATDKRWIGVVHDLLPGVDGGQVRYLDVDLDRALLGEQVDEERHVLIPIGRAQLDEGHNRVRVDLARGAAAATLPAYEHGPLTPVFETLLRQCFDAEYTTLPTATSGFYDDEMYDEARFFGPGRASAGAGGGERR